MAPSLRTSIWKDQPWSPSPRLPCANHPRQPHRRQESKSTRPSNARACLGESFASYRLVYADRIVVRAPGREESFDIANLAPLVGALLLRPDANARILFAGGGPEALRGMLGRAVSDYFGKQCEGESRVRRSSKTKHVPNGASSGRGGGVPLLGMAKFMQDHAAFNALLRDGRATWVRSPNAKPIGEAGAAGTNEHGGFDDDKATVASTLAFVLGTSRGAAQAVKAVAQSYAPMAGAKRVQGLREVVEKAG